MITQKRRIGDNGEEIACQFLRKNGYSIVERNYSCKFGEIDIIVKKGNTLHFIEVKTAKRGSEISAEENITAHKLRKFIRAIGVYFSSKKISPHVRWQIDAITVYINSLSGEPEIIHFENINIQ